MRLTIKLLIGLLCSVFAFISTVVFVILWVRHKRKEDEYYDIEEGPVFGILLVSGILSLVFSILTVASAEYRNNIVCEKIVSIEKGLETTGSFVLGTGSIGSEVYYYTYQDLGNSRYKLAKFEANKTIIVETLDTHYYVADIKKKDELSANYYIYVPVGVITKEFKL